MKKGLVVIFSTDYSGGAFTTGCKYEVVCGQGDVSSIYGEILTENAFTAIDDYGDEQFCLYPSCAHGEWEVHK